jgi:xanthine dehydrogenase YagS FAD-binding subunit
MNSFEWTEAATVADALTQIGGGSVVKAGGLDLLDRMKEGIDSPSRLVNIRNVRELRGVRQESGGSLWLGPLTTLAELDAHPVVRQKFTALADAAGHAATPQIRNVATLGGNLLQRPRCWYFRSEDFHCRKKGGSTCFAHEGENQYHAIFGNEVCAIVHPSATATALVALEARIELTGPTGKREIALEDFFLTPEEDVRRENKLGERELITGVRVQSPPHPIHTAYLKQGEKESFDWPLADVAVALNITGGTCRVASVILGAAAPVPLRAPEAEKALVGKAVNEETARAAAKAAVRGATPLAQNAYKLPIFEALVRRALLAAASGAEGGLKK